MGLRRARRFHCIACCARASTSAAGCRATGCSSSPRGLVNRQRPSRVREVARRHYDLDPALYRAMLGEGRVYSCGYWRDAATLAEAQTAKIDLVCRKLGLRPGMRVLDIGCGWGTAARHAAERYGVEGGGHHHLARAGGGRRSSAATACRSRSVSRTTASSTSASTASSRSACSSTSATATTAPTCRRCAAASPTTDCSCSIPSAPTARRR